MRQVSEKEVKNRLYFDNPWWKEEGGIGSRHAQMPRRDYFEPFFSLVSDQSINRAVILMGPRRVGKTVMVHHAIDRLLEGGKVDHRRILYLSLETPIYTGLSLTQLLGLFKEQFAHADEDGLFVFFDEIQYLRNWEVHLKSLVDDFPRHKFVATGSAAAALRLKSQESGAGRFTDFLLPPLTFAEYLRFIGREGELIDIPEQPQALYQSNKVEQLNQEFVNYLNYGGYPEAVFSRTVQADSSRFIKSDIIDKVLLRDLPSLYGISDIQELNRLFMTLAYNTGNEITLEALSKSSGVAKNTLKRYLEYLEAAFLIRRVSRVDDTARSFQRATSFKVYLTNPSMRAALFGYIETDSEAMGHLTETAIYSQWLHSDYIANLSYARWKSGEVDIVSLNAQDQSPAWCVEVKWSDLPFGDHRKLESLRYFVEKHPGMDMPLVTTKTLRGVQSLGSLQVRFIPSAEYAYSLGRNILQYKRVRRALA